jgi:DNA-binding transcriptional LysR family regulator
VAPATQLGSLDDLATWLAGQAWVSYSVELPLTRRFWTTVLGHPFPARLRLVAPDLRVVLKAVELGLGVSMLPTFVCTDALAGGRVVEVFPVSPLGPEEPWFACTRHGDTARGAVRTILGVLQEASRTDPETTHS